MATNISELGEFGLIKHLTQHCIIKNSSTIKGIGDDAAVLDYKDNKIIVTTDMLLEGVHFDLVYTPLKHLGYKAVVVNLSDIYAMNATPKQITVSLGISAKFTVEAIDELYSGIYYACEQYGIDIIGGDTCSSYTGLTISITAIGEANSETIVYRNGAKENDLICVSGDLGAAYVGLQLLKREKEVFITNPSMQPEFKGNEYILQRQLKPEARFDVIKELKELQIKPTAMIDISDGLSSELFHICTQSNVGCKLFEERIPIDDKTKKMAFEINIDPTTCVLNGGEDYELLFTIPITEHEKLKDNMLISIIGHITSASEGLNLITRDGHSVPLKAQGWEAFNSLKKD